MDEIIISVSAYLIEGPAFPGDPMDYTEIKRSGGIIDGVVRLADLDRWKVERQGRVLSDEGNWVFEPLPSSRDTDFLLHHRFPLKQAEALALQYAVEPWNDAVVRSNS